MGFKTLKSTDIEILEKSAHLYSTSPSDLISIIVSIIALFISIYSIVSQNKGVVFEHRLSIYIKTAEIYNRFVEIIKLCPNKELKAQRLSIAMTLFKLKSNELEISQKYIKSRTDEDAPLTQEEADILEKYAEFYISNYMYESLDQECGIFFSKDIHSSASKLYIEYNLFVLNFLFIPENRLNDEYDKIKSILQDFQKNKTLEKMKKKLPIC